MIELDVFNRQKVATPFDNSLIMRDVHNRNRGKYFQK